MRGNYYLGAPYWHVDLEVRERRYREVVKCRKYMESIGLRTFAPIEFIHVWELAGNNPYCPSGLLKRCMAWLEEAGKLAVLITPGWETELETEIAFAREHKFFPILAIVPYGDEYLIGDIDDKCNLPVSLAIEKTLAIGEIQ